MKFSQRTIERRVDPETGRYTLVGPGIRITVEADAGFPRGPDLISTEIGQLVAKWLAPERSISVRTSVDPWPLPADWPNDGPTCHCVCRSCAGDEHCGEGKQEGLGDCFYPSASESKGGGE